MDDNEMRSTRNRKGWLLPYLIALDDMFFKRWKYWLNICNTNNLPEEPIPYIPFSAAYDYREQKVQKNLKKCLQYAAHYGDPFLKFVDWILWGLGRTSDFPDISDKIDDYWYRTFNLGLFYLEPADHWGDLASEYIGKRGQQDSGFFATPANVVKMMTLMTMGGEPELKHRIMSVMEPCCGTGVMLLYMSNYSLNMYAQDKSITMTKLATINAMIYIPWMIVSGKHLTIFSKKPNISEVEFSSGVKIPRCEECSPDRQSFYMNLKTDHTASVNTEGLISIQTPGITTDLINRKLKPENIHCAHCEKED